MLRDVWEGNKEAAPRGWLRLWRADRPPWSLGELATSHGSPV